MQSKNDFTRLILGRSGRKWDSSCKRARRSGIAPHKKSYLTNVDDEMFVICRFDVALVFLDLDPTILVVVVCVKDPCGGGMCTIVFAIGDSRKRSIRALLQDVGIVLTQKILLAFVQATSA